MHENNIADFACSVIILCEILSLYYARLSNYALRRMPQDLALRFIVYIGLLFDIEIRTKQKGPEHLLRPFAVPHS